MITLGKKYEDLRTSALVDHFRSVILNLGSFCRYDAFIDLASIIEDAENMQDASAELGDMTATWWWVNRKNGTEVLPSKAEALEWIAEVVEPLNIYCIKYNTTTKRYSFEWVENFDNKKSCL